MKLPYYPSLDGLRGIAALLVVMFHFYAYPNGYYSGESLYKNMTAIGQHGVSLFFVLSGFVITRILLQTRSSNTYFSSFFIRRFFRIAPLYYLFLIFWFYVLPFIISYPLASLHHQLPYFLYLQNVYSTWDRPLSGPPHFWSLAVEEHFYVLWPFVVYHTPLKRLSTVIVLSIVSTFIIKFLMIKNGFSIHDFTLTRIDQILMGAFLALLELKRIFKPESIKYFLLLALTIIPISCVVYMFADKYMFLKELFKYFLLGVTFTSLIGIVLSHGNDSLIQRFLSHPLLQYFGKISYGIYVWHVVALIFLQFFLLTQVMIVDMAIAIVLTVAMAHVSYFYFEIAFIRLKDQLSFQPGTRMTLVRNMLGWLQVLKTTGKGTR